jgi:hypothetical protein
MLREARRQRIHRMQPTLTTLLTRLHETCEGFNRPASTSAIEALLLPAPDTALAVELLQDPDMWTPEKAVVLLELRGYERAVPELEQLARGGHPNGDSAALRALARLQSPGAAAALERLQGVLAGQKRSLLDQWRRARLLPPRW